ncbi:hypothetical protein RHSIM_Rhsim09G0191100 [Rhododendron simsii]|uniref:Sugar phosphate transporter domain-containing protein n=1 Tax=Rhododendron simsii TaxID=118357 RepID=A0A834LC98_RHOSS|nr:hypothetical protein RHSIM_Rhsim09G0191100 [Rhododendron simsii]
MNSARYALRASGFIACSKRDRDATFQGARRRRLGISKPPTVNDVAVFGWLVLALEVACYAILCALHSGPISSDNCKSHHLVNLPQMPNDVETTKDGEAQKGSGGGPDSLSHSGETQVTWYSVLLQQASVYGIAVGYCISASLLSIINKWAVMKFPYPGALTALQYFTSAAGVFLCGRLKLIEHEPLELLTMWRFLPAAFIFYLSLFTNSELLLHANVDTFIVFRSAVPIFVAIGESLYLHRPWPTMRTWISLSTIFGGSVLYVLTDYQFTLMAYTWALAYLVSMSIDFVYIKHVVMTIGLSTWGLVLYNNLEALLLFPLELLVMGELKKIKHEISDESDWYSFQVVLPVGLSCLFGLAISFFGFSCRRAISATGFTVLGIVNKLLTVVINLVIWDKHSTFVGTIGLLICMIGGIMYQQSTSNKPKAVTDASSPESEQEQQKLLELQSTAESNDVEKQVTDSGEGKILASGIQDALAQAVADWSICR